MVVDVVGVLELGEEVILPAVVDGGVGDAVGAELGGEGDAGAIERKVIVGEGDAVGRP